MFDVKDASDEELNAKLNEIRQDRANYIFRNRAKKKVLKTSPNELPELLKGVPPEIAEKIALQILAELNLDE